MTITVIGVEGATLAEYISETADVLHPALAAARGLLQDWGGIDGIVQRLAEYRSASRADEVFLVFDGDVFGRPGTVQGAAVASHAPSFAFTRDFEAAFPDWIIAEALQAYDPSAGYPDSTVIRAACRKRGPGTPSASFYERLVICIRDCVARQGCDPSAVRVPDKIELARELIKLAKRMRYEPPAIRQLFDDLANALRIKMGQSLITRGADARPFLLNMDAIDRMGLTGRVLLTISPRLWLLDLHTQTATPLSDRANGPGVWSPDGTRVALPSIPSTRVRNSEAILIIDPSSRNASEHLRAGNYLCWSKENSLYANSLQGDGLRVHEIRVDEPGYRRVLPLPAGSIVSCVDRKRDRLLMGDTRNTGRRTLSIFRANDGSPVAEDVAAGLALSEYSAGAFSPDGNTISLPVGEGLHSDVSGLWILGVNDRTRIRVTHPEGRVQNSCWSGDGHYLLFMWCRWRGDPVRVWVFDTRTAELAPLIEAPFRDLYSLSCHGWA